MGVEFRLLGHVEAYIDDRIVEVGHARQQCVLVALLIDANRLVPVGLLLDRVWADRPPQRARNALSGYLSRLRQAFAGADGVSLARRREGYLLTVEPDAVDLHRFHRLIADARATDNDEAAAALLAQALGLWRGEAFATLDTPWLNTVRASLDADRLAATLNRNDLGLRRGQHAELVGELSRYAAAFPLDERLAAQLMLALYRCGRQADALRHYQGIRARLADELGADPNPGLRQLHHQMLTADPALTPTRSVTVPPPRAAMPVPRQLPAPAPSFVGRARELAELDAILAGAGVHQPVTICALSGTAGVGKTTLALHWAHRVAHAFGDGHLYLNLRGFDPSGSAMEASEALRVFLDTLGVPAQQIPASFEAQSALYRSLLAGKRMLVVLDNARDVEQVRPLLPGTPGCMVVVTSRTVLTGLVAANGAYPLTLDLLTHAEARELLTHRLGRDRVRADPAAVDDIVHQCARLPLALVIVAARAATHAGLTLDQVAVGLRDAASSLDTLTDVEPTIDVRTVFSWSYRALGSGAARLFRLLGMHPGPDIGIPAAASLAGVPTAAVRPLLAELSWAHLVTEHPAGRYACHDLLRVYAAELARALDEESEHHHAQRRMLDHYVHTAHMAALLLEPQRDPLTLAGPEPGITQEDVTDPERALAWFYAEHEVLLGAIELAHRTAFDTHTWQLAWATAAFLAVRGHWAQLTATSEAALDAATRLGDRLALANAHRSLARVMAHTGHQDNAGWHGRRALDLYGELGDHTGQAHTHLTLGWLSAAQTRDGDSLRHAEEALRLYRLAGNRAGQANALNAIGWSHARLADYQLALAVCAEAAEILGELGDRPGEARTWDSLGYAHHHLGHDRDALGCYKRATELFRDTGDRPGEADTLAKEAEVHEGAGDTDAARRAWRKALAILDQLGDPEADKIRARLGQVQPA